ncbi:MAG: hypothetical protein AAGH81_19325, partial [Bacteroidota bacterium]
EKGLLDANFEITPYVNVFNRPPDSGFSQFMDHPRYSTGYATLWNTLGMMVETHMLKPYKYRVEGTYGLMKEMVEIIEVDHKKIKSLRAKANALAMNSEKFLLNWTLDTTKTNPFDFKGFKADTILSEITGMPRLKYDREQPFEKEIPYQNEYYPQDTITIPEAYIIKKGWKKVMDRLAANQIEFYELEEDTLLTVEGYRIASYETYSKSYEGHYPHYGTKVSVSKMSISFDKGDYVIPTKQPGIRYILETLEPEAVDSFFNWNFFDTVLQQKEGFSPYVFEDLALTILEENPALRDSLERKKQKDETFAQNWYGQLDWIYNNSQYKEPAHLQYPVYRILTESDTISVLKN